MSRVIISKRIETKYLSKYIFRYLYYLSINRDLLDNKSDLSNSTKLYRKLFDTKINKLDILEDKKDNKIVKYYILLKQRLELWISWQDIYIYLYLQLLLLLHLLYLTYWQQISFVIVNSLLNTNIEIFFAELAERYNLRKNTDNNRDSNCFLEIFVSFYSISK